MPDEATTVGYTHRLSHLRLLIANARVLLHGHAVNERGLLHSPILELCGREEGLNRVYEENLLAISW